MTPTTEQYLVEVLNNINANLTHTLILQHMQIEITLGMAKNTIGEHAFRTYTAKMDDTEGVYVERNKKYHRWLKKFIEETSNQEGETK